MKTRRQHVSEDDVTVCRRNTRPKTTSINGVENALPIPIDLVFEIFSRLSATSVAICRCVSKLWASTLGCQDFKELFLKRSSACPQLLFVVGQNFDVFSFFSSPQLQNPDANSSHAVATRLMHFPFDSFYEMSGGSVHGLVCLVYNKQIPKGRKETVPVICNPSTGQSLTLPKVRTKRVNVISYLGYDPVGKQFKVLSMTWPILGNQKGMCGEHQVLTLGPGKLSWRLIDCSAVPHGILYNENRICINGVLYYQAWVLGFSKVIICFDVSSEKFTVINLDKGMVRWHEPTLVNYKGKLGALTASDFGSFRTVSGDTECLQLWVLVDAEKHEWLKYTYVLPPLWKNVVGNARLHFVGLTGTNEIVLSSDDPSGPFCVFYYNFESQTVRKVEMQGIHVVTYPTVHIFVDHVENVKLMEMFLPRVS